MPATVEVKTTRTVRFTHQWPLDALVKKSVYDLVYEQVLDQDIDLDNHAITRIASHFEIEEVFDGEGQLVVKQQVVSIDYSLSHEVEDEEYDPAEDDS